MEDAQLKAIDKEFLSFASKYIYTGSKGKSLRFLPKLPFPVPDCRGGCCCVKIEGYSGAFQLWKWLMTAEVRVEAERGGGGGGGGQGAGWQWENVL